MKLCIMKGQMHAKTPTGLRCRIAFPRDKSYVGNPGSCEGCIKHAEGPCLYPQGCLTGQRADQIAGGIWVPDLPF